VGDVILLAQRGVGRSRPNLARISAESLPPDLFLSEEIALRIFKERAKAAADYFRSQGVDLAAYNTAVDLVKFAIAVNTDKLLKQATREQMWTVQKTKDGKETGYALGWSIGQTAEGMRLVMHNGNQAGARSELSLLPAKGSVIAIMANLSDVPLNEVLRVVGREVIAAIRE